MTGNLSRRQDRLDPRPDPLLAVSAVVFQTGRRQPSTSSVAIWSTGFCQIGWRAVKRPSGDTDHPGPRFWREPMDTTLVAASVSWST